MTAAFIQTKSCKQSNMDTSTITHHHTSDVIPKTSNIHRQALDACRRLIQKQGIHSTIAMNSAGFHYTNKGDEARCDTCGLDVSGWTLDMHPFTTHARCSPTCTFVRSMQPTERIAVPKTIALPVTTAESSDDEVSFKRRKTEATQENTQPNILVEVETLMQIRKRTFSHWPQKKFPSSAQMIEAGFFGCNIGDRVICLYCNIICQTWMPNTDDPCEIHKILSPKCPYVLSMSARSRISSIPIINEHSTRDNSAVSADNNHFQHDQIVTTAACNVTYAEIPKRYASFTAWPSDNSPSVEDLVRAGFFFTGTKTIVTCFYCNGSLQNWSAADNPTNEHARWFPHCAYAKQLCGAEHYRKIQESNRRRKDRNHHENRSCANSSSSELDEKTLARLVAARLDLPISQKLLDQNFKVAIIKRCWEDQLKLKCEDFVSDSDLLIACIVLRKQIELINGKQENITVPSVAMKNIRERKQPEIVLGEQMTVIPSSENSSNNTDMEMATSTPITDEKQSMKLDNAGGSGVGKENYSVPLNPCALCLTEERGLACIPCGHLATCVPCGHSLRSCPICRTKIDGFVRIYM